MPIKYKCEWKTGDKTKLARASGISPSWFSEILHNRRPCSGRLATILERHARLLGYRMTKKEWVFPEERLDNPLFPDPTTKIPDSYTN